MLIIPFITLERLSVVFSAGKQQNHIFKLLQDEVINNLWCDPHDLWRVHERGQLRVSIYLQHNLHFVAKVFLEPHSHVFLGFTQNLTQNTSLKKRVLSKTFCALQFTTVQ